MSIVFPNYKGPFFKFFKFFFFNFSKFKHISYRFQASPSSSPQHIIYDNFQNSVVSGQFCPNITFSEEASNSCGNGAHGGGGTWNDSNQTGFHLPSAVSAAAAAMALSPSHLGYINQDVYHHNQVP